MPTGRLSNKTFGESRGPAGFGRSRDPPEKVELTLICFAKGGQNKVLEYFTKEEMQFIWEN
ncbi:hypothetical protein FOZ63_024977, partial [Perkinsus olseni]